MQNIVFGILTGSTLAVATVGFALVRQTEGFVNIAHGQYLALGAFLGLFFMESWGVSVFLAGFLAVVAVAVLGVVVARLVFDPVRERGALVLFFSSIGLAYALYGINQVVFDPAVRAYPVNFGKNIDLGSASITVGELVVIGIAAASVILLHVFLTRTTLGTWVRAVAANPELAEVRGVRVRLTSGVVWFIGAGLAALAGVLIGVLGTVHSEIGWANILMILAAAVVGGLGNIYGVIAAGLLLGLAMDLSTLVIPTEYRLTVAFAAIIITLLLRPEGLFTVARRKEEVA
ncbi:MAG: branched-chain amino acid transport system permease protein [Thermoleophilaceae bacterium]|jgi:neutral amino acid transport system permease protein|nr:branched-chain amino acid transport system permease protein [Thermoleophilaceae bacterium]MEA2400710.1 branched-chain amino acid transport system permease protein [Thermoleophilaceae bacterium]